MVGRLRVDKAIYPFHGFRFGPTVWSDLTSWLTAVLP
jgi:hypothetical protein